MKEGIQNKIEALNLRKSGMSYREISIQLKVPKATIVSWTQGVSLTEYQRTLLTDRLKLKQKQGRFMAGIALKARRVYREKAAFDTAEAEFKVLINEPFFSYGIGLYSGKSKKDETRKGKKNSSNFQFTDSDPQRVAAMLMWIEKYLKVPAEDIKLRLFSYEPYRTDQHELLWARSLSIPVDRLQKTMYVRTDHFFIKKPDYKGSIMITVSNIKALRTVFAWQKLVIKYYKETVSTK